jgi:glycogen phosphorylase
MANYTAYHLEVHPRVPPRLARLEQLANNLWYTWDRPTRTLFARLHTGLWDAVGHNPKAFLKRIDERRLLNAVDDSVFLGNFNRVLSAFDTYHSEPMRRDGSEWLRQGDCVAYFCFEFGFHESLKIYSGGLGILAGDYCKAASDMRLPFIAMGLLYRQGYLNQTIDNEGNQHAHYTDAEFEDLPIEPVLGAEGREIRVHVSLPGRPVAIKVWQATAGHVKLYLLDTDLDENSSQDRDIGHRLYGGDRVMRIEQEIVLGVGGVRALKAMGIKPSIWHINEGHAAFQIVERMRELMAHGLDCETALEAVAVDTVFTTHTPVPAGHDHFPHDMILRYFEDECQRVDFAPQDLLALGASPEGPEFNMTALAIRGSRYYSAVSKIHGAVTSHTLAGLWPQIEAEENPLQYVTNGVHVPTFLAPEWGELFERFLGYDWSQRLSDEGFWKQVDGIPDHLFWSVRQGLKAQLLHLVRYRVSTQHFRNNGSEAHLDRLLRWVDPTNPNILTIGFARRFATYKRATLLFENVDWLKEIVSNQERPVLFLFGGKAHPADVPGQELIRQVHHITRMPEFEGKILLLEDYDLALARRMVAGVDVWLNNPVYPLEACGTSGMKAGMNGVINLSVLDGWWGEGYDGKNGWAIKPASQDMEEYRRNREESRTLYEILQDHVIPLYYNHGKLGYSPGWVKMSKYSITSLLPRYNSTRMVSEYLKKFYLPASRRGPAYRENEYANARAIAGWKAKVRRAWSGVSLLRQDAPKKAIAFGESVLVRVAVNLNGLAPEDVVVEMLMGHASKKGQLERVLHHRLEFEGVVEAGQHHFVLQLTPELCGKLLYRIRVYPCHKLLTHPLEMGMMVWL